MRLNVTLELPDNVAITGPCPTRLEILDSEVRDPAQGVVGRTVGPARVNWRDGRRYLEVTVDVDEKAMVAALSPFRSTF